jgi:ribosomal protein L11 methyltransferase
MREGLLPHKVTTVMSFDTDEASARRLTDMFGELFDPEETGIAAFELEPGPRWKMEVYFAEEPDEAAVRAMIADCLGAEMSRRVQFNPIAAKDWVAASLSGLKPVEAGRFLVHGAHDRPRAARRKNRIGLEIEAALAFGTGHHGTTLGCLRALDRVLKRSRPRNILDIGTGTGVLAIAAALATKRRVTATDIDPVAVTVARENGKLNAATTYIRPITAPGLRHSAIQRGIPYDLILANILYKPLTKLAPDIARAASRQAELILSGLLSRDVPGIVSAYRANGFALREQTRIEGWATLVLHRAGQGRLKRRWRSDAAP